MTAAPTGPEPRTDAAVGDVGPAVRDPAVAMRDRVVPAKVPREKRAEAIAKAAFDPRDVP